VSFISLRTMLTSVIRFLTEEGEIVALVKPQFEAGRSRIGRGGVVRDPAVHQEVLREVCDAARALGLTPLALIASPLRGPAGNREFLLHLRRKGESLTDERIAEVVGEESKTI
ncbi:MAG TPA: SAM-dependent methyltransferase, partial [Candidatus Dormibacteraeota bacterium]|nr:SAM-dependent methyltransferase [Candidatus Dormibacteraeota bacterium]